MSGPSQRERVQGGAGAAELNGLQRQEGEPSGPHQHRRRSHHCYTTPAQSLTRIHPCTYTLQKIKT